jgi:DNA polymerase elongation subunit (family B)
MFDLKSLLFIDVTTVPQEKSLEDLEIKNPVLHDIFINSRSIFNERIPVTKDMPLYTIYTSYASIYPEFGKIICVSLGAIDKEGKLKITTYDGEEKDILFKLKMVLETAENKYTICGYNIKSFDLPYLGKRFLINNIKPPKILPKHDTKPWEIKALDVRDVWTFGGFKSFSSLEIICNLLGIETKGIIKGEDVNQNYNNHDIDKIKEYSVKQIEYVSEIVKKINSYE